MTRDERQPQQQVVFGASIRLNIEDMMQMRPEQVEAIMVGIAKVQAELNRACPPSLDATGATVTQSELAAALHGQ